MAKTDWKNSDIVKPDDMNQIGQEINQLYTEIEERLDTVKSSDMTLQPRLQVVNAAKDARFRLGEVRGRTLINLLGSAGSFDSLTGWSVVGTAAIDTTNKVEGSGCAAITVTNEQYADIFQRFSYNPSKNYIAVARVKMVSGVAMALRMNDNAVPKEMKSPLMSTLNKFETVFIRVPANFFTGANIVYISALLSGPNDSSGYVDALRVYEISDAEYAVIDGMTTEQVAEKYPFGLIGIRGVDGPYTISTFDNLVPPLYEATILSTHAIVNPYELSMGVTDQTAYTIIPLIAKPNTDYTIKVEGDNFSYSIFPVDLTEPNPPVPWITSNVHTFNSGDNTELRLLIRSSDRTKQAVFKNPILVPGAEPKPFVPQHKSMLAFQTPLYANPNDGSDPDELYEQNGQYFKLEKWKKVVLDGSIPWVFAQSFSGYKAVAWLDVPDPVSDSGTITKYDGKILGEWLAGSTATGTDQHVLDGATDDLWITISNIDSGWGPDYTPTQDEIKAYFWGWRMRQEDTIDQPYTSGKKYWRRITDNEGVTDILPTSSYLGFTPYQLLYRLAKATVEPVTSEGALLLTEGDNMVEVGMGIVLRESAKPTYYSTNGNYYINNTAVSGSLLKNKVSRILRVYRNGQVDNSAKVENDVNAYGKQHVRFLPADFNPNAAYSVTYLKLDKSPIQPIAGSLAANEKAQISDLTAGVAEALRRVSVVERKKADEEAPGWISSTLLNGATGSVKYRKIGLTLYVGGTLFTGAKIAGTVLFRLPYEYAPKTVLTSVLATYDSGAELRSVVVDFYPDGSVKLASDARSVIIFNSVSVSLDWR
ncbi:hypothetical protein [Paenibacillus sp. TH7-28]